MQYMSELWRNRY